MGVESSEIEAAIHHCLASLPAMTSWPGGKLYIKVALEDHAEDAAKVDGGLFLSMPYASADKAWLQSLMAGLRERFDGTEQRRVAIGEDEEVSAFDDAEAGTRLLNLLSSLSITPRTLAPQAPTS